jgi:AcrR family transcriptional regulator
MNDDSGGAGASGGPDSVSGAVKVGKYHHGDLRNALLRATEALLATEPAEAISLRAVARAAGVSAAAPYHHFASKAELLAAVSADGFIRMDEEMRAHASRHANPVDRLLGLGVGYVSWARANPGVYKIMHGQARYLSAETPELAAAAGRSLSLLQEHVATVAALSPEPDPSLEGVIATAAWSIVHGLAMLMADCAVAPPTGMALQDYVADVLYRGLPGMFGLPRVGKADL